MTLDLSAIVAIVFSALLGLVAGAVVNALADELPFTYKLRLPYYPDESPRPPIAWIGLLAFLTRRRVSATGSKLSWRHPLTEIALAFLFGYVASLYGLTGRSLFWMGVLAILALITVIDLEHRLILFAVIIPGCLYAVVGAYLFGRDISDRITFQDYIIGGVVGFTVFGLMYLGGILFSQIMASMRGEPLDEVAFGYGDVMLATLSGFILGWQALIFAIFIAVFAGAAGALLFIVGRFLVKGSYDLYTALPYGQYIVFGTVVMLLWRAPLMSYLQR